MSTDPAKNRKKRKNDSRSPGVSDASNVKKAEADSVRAFLADLSVDTINSLNKADLISRLCSAVDLLATQLLLISELESKVSRLDEYHVSDLESKILLLNDDLGNRDDQIKTLEENAVQIKVCFAEHVLSLQQARPPGFAGPSFSGPSAPGPSYASVACGNLSGSVLGAKCADDSAPPLNVQAVEDLLDTKNSGLIPTNVRYKNNKLFVTLDNEVAVAKDADILNKKPEFHARFDTASKLNVLLSTFLTRSVCTESCNTTTNC
jgi:hypothetical protein